MTQLDHCGYGGFLVLRRKTTSLSKSTHLWEIQGRCEI